ncbi:hypothetical protein F4803DRAFT_407897 [Xylaria telfairii]|nr:hypothetical protein F4803DRAFT_407897 [Xylaria telfairii]
MPTTPAGPLRKAWQVWKSLRLPWRKRFFVGQDPHGNTYYELRQPRGDMPTSTPRRLVHYPRSTHYSEVRVTPAWHQWLRYQRAHPPTMEEQMAELQRQARIKVLAAEADARWEAKDSLLEMPSRKTTKTTGGIAQGGVKGGGEGDARGGEREDTQKPDPDPWKQAAQRGAPGETWQPEAWAPAPAKKR